MLSTNYYNVYNLPRLRHSNFNRSNERKAFQPKKGRSRRYPTEKMTDYANDLALHANTPARADTYSRAWSKQQEALAST